MNEMSIYEYWYLAGFYMYAHIIPVLKYRDTLLIHQNSKKRDVDYLFESWMSIDEVKENLSTLRGQLIDYLNKK